MCVLFSTEWLAERMHAALVFEAFRDAVQAIKDTHREVTMDALSEETKIPLADVRQYTFRNPRRMRYLGIRMHVTSEAVSPAPGHQRTTVPAEILRNAERYNAAKRFAATENVPATLHYIAHRTNTPEWMVAAFAKTRPQLLILEA